MTVTFKNERNKSVSCTYDEYAGANFETIQFQTAPKESLPLRYTNKYSENKIDNSAAVAITAQSEDPMLITERGDMSRYDVFPPLLFMKSLSENAVFIGNNDGICARFSFVLAPDEEKTISVIIGYSFEYGNSTQKNICAELSEGKKCRSLFAPLQTSG